MKIKEVATDRSWPGLAQRSALNRSFGEAVTLRPCEGGGRAGLIEELRPDQHRVIDVPAKEILSKERPEQFG